MTGVALVAGAFAVFWIVRRSLRPLDRVAATARQVTTLPLDRGEVDLGVRVPEKDTDTRTEVGQVGSALNQMLGHVSGALKARQESETRVRQFVADASHDCGHPWPRSGDTPSWPGATGGTPRPSATRCGAWIGVGAHVDAGRGPVAAGPAGLRPAALGGRGRPEHAGHRRGVRRTGRRAHPPLAVGSAGGAGRGHRRRRPPAPGAGQPAHQRANAHPGRHPGLLRPAHGGRPARPGRGHHGDGRRARHPGRPAADDLRALRPRRLVPVRAAGSTAWAWPSSRQSSAPTAAPWEWRAGPVAPSSPSGCPGPAAERASTRHRCRFQAASNLQIWRVEGVILATGERSPVACSPPREAVVMSGAADPQTFEDRRAVLRTRYLLPRASGRSRPPAGCTTPRCWPPTWSGRSGSTRVSWNSRSPSSSRTGTTPVPRTSSSTSATAT